LSLRLDCAGVRRAEDAGHLAYVQARARPCLDAVRAMTCHAFELAVPGQVPRVGWPPECDGVTVPLVEPGGTCYGVRDLECAGGSCAFSSCYLAGACVQYLGAGDPCRAGRCAPGLACSGGRCVASPPPPEAAEGEPCGTAVAPCAEGLFCDHATNPSTCRPRRASGPCDGFDECAVGLDCVGGDCVPERNAGAACEQGARQCVEGTWCDASSRCVPWSRDGGICGEPASGEEASCRDGWCDRPLQAAQGTCRPYLGVGGACAGLPEVACGPRTICSEGTCVRNYCGGK
jgi:hypothetical protein